MHPPPTLDQLRYPVGHSPRTDVLSSRPLALSEIGDLPATLSQACTALNDSQLDTPYREQGWTVRQVVHHVADSHLNAYVRLRLALTEDWPAIKAYDEKQWAELADARTAPVERSLELLVPLHARWVQLLGSLDEAGWERGYLHPESGRTTIAAMTQLYAWHGRHHTAHVSGLRERMGW